MPQDHVRPQASELAGSEASAGRPRWTWLWWLVPAGAIALWYWGLATVAQQRIDTLQNVGPSAFAVYNQIFWNFAQAGIFEQTILSGYVNNWVWSGHRSPWIFVVGWLYHLAPEPLTLCRIQIAAVALGGLPAFGLGWRAFGGPWGGIAGLVMYLGYPPLAVLALNDYQEIVLGIPLAVAAVHQAWRGSAWGFALACLATAASREEWILVVPFLGLLAQGAWRERLVWVARALAVVLVYFGVLCWVSFDGRPDHHPELAQPGPSLPSSWGQALERARTVLAPISYPSEVRADRAWKQTWLGSRQITRSRHELIHFYLDLGAPIHLVSVFAPSALIPALGALAVHLTAPRDIAIDADWGGTVHHMAPIVALIVLGAILGAGWGYRRTRGQRRLWIPLGVVAAFLVLAVGRPWEVGLELPWAPPPPHGSTWRLAPEWHLVSQVPPEARVATDQRASLIVSGRRHCYTYDDSLQDKAPGRGGRGNFREGPAARALPSPGSRLKAVDYLLVRRGHRDWVARVQGMPGSMLVGETPEYLLFRLPWADPVPPKHGGTGGKG